MALVERKGQYKHPSKDVDSLKTRRREIEIGLRKERREKLLASKRIRSSHKDEDISETGTSIDEVTQLTHALVKGAGDQASTLERLKSCLECGSLFIDAFLKVEGGLRAVVGAFTSSAQPRAQLEAAWCLTNLAAGPHHLSVGVAREAAPYMVTYLTSASTQLQDQCAWALGNLAGDGDQCRDMLVAQGALQPLTTLLHSDSATVVQSAAFALSNMARWPGTTAKSLVELEVGPTLINMLTNNKHSEDIVTEVAWILAYIVANAEAEVGRLLDEGLVEAVTQVLVDHSKQSPHNVQVVTPLIRCLGNACAAASGAAAGPAAVGRAATNPSLLASLESYLHPSAPRHLKKETLWLLSNMLANCSGVGEMSQRVCQGGGTICQRAVELVASTSGAADVRAEAAHLLCQVAYCGDAGALHQLLALGALASMAVLLRSRDHDDLMLALSFADVALSTAHPTHQPLAHREFEEAGGVARLEALEYHDNPSVRGLAAQLLDTHYYHPDELEEWTC